MVEKCQEKEEIGRESTRGSQGGVDIQMNELDTCDTSLLWKSIDARRNIQPTMQFSPPPPLSSMQQVLILRNA